MYTHHLQKLARTRLEDVLLDEGVLDRSQIDLALQDAQQSGLPLSQVLSDREVLDEWALAKLISVHYSLPFLDLSDMSLNWDLIELIPLEFCYQNRVLPLGEFGPSVAVAVTEMPDPQCIDAIINQSGKVPFLYVVTRRQLVETLDQMARHSGQDASASSASSSSMPPQPAPTQVQTEAQEVSVAPDAGELNESDMGDMETGGWEDGGAWESIFDLGDDAVKADIE